MKLPNIPLAFPYIRFRKCKTKNFAINSTGPFVFCHLFPTSDWICFLHSNPIPWYPYQSPLRSSLPVESRKDSNIHTCGFPFFPQPPCLSCIHDSSYQTSKQLNIKKSVESHEMVVWRKSETLHDIPSRGEFLGDKFLPPADLVPIRIHPSFPKGFVFKKGPCAHWSPCPKCREKRHWCHCLVMMQPR